jgi:hypothetical protein
MTCKSETIKRKNEMVEDLNNKEAVIIECPECRNSTFIGVGQAFSSDGMPYPIGDCAQCLKGMRNLESETDLELMMEFRSNHWEEWVKFCLEKDYRPCVEK